MTDMILDGLETDKTATRAPVWRDLLARIKTLLAAIDARLTHSPLKQEEYVSRIEQAWRDNPRFRYRV